MPAANPVVAFGAQAIILFLAGKVLETATAPDSHGDTTRIDRSILANQCNSQSPLPLCYGRSRVGINQVYASSRGNNNMALDMICVLGEGEISGLVREDLTTYTATGSVLPTENPPLIYLNDKRWDEYASYISIQFFNGSASQAVCPTLAGYDTDFTQAMRRTAYLFITLSYDRENFNSLPRITAVLDGLKVYNPVTSTTVWSDNAALCAYDFLTRSSTRGGMGLATSAVDTQAVSDAIDYCDDLGWTCNMGLNEQVYAADNLKKLLDCFRGRIPASDNGKYRILFRDLNYESTAMALTDADIIDGSFSLSQPDVLSRPNAIRVKYYAKAINYQIQDYVYTDTVALAADGDYRETTVDLLGLSTVDKVSNMAYYLLERARNAKTVTVTGRRRTLALEPEDLVTLTHRVPGWTAQTMRVVATSPDLTNFTNQLTLIEESTEFYDGDYDNVIEDLFTTSLPDPNATVPNVTGVSHSEQVYPYRGQSFTRWLINFQPPDESVYPWFDYAEIWVRIGTDGAYKYYTRSEKDYVLDPVEEGQHYAVKMVSVNIFGKKENFDSALSVSKTILGKSEDPSNLAFMTAIANGSTVSIYADKVDDPDIDGYEIRLGDSFLGGIFIKYANDPSATIGGVRPGTHTFWMTPVRLATDGTRIYSGTPVSANCTVRIPPSYASVDTEVWDFDAIGSHDNSEHTTYDTADAMICSHTGSVLTGTWSSPVWDLTSVQTVKVWADFATAFVASTTTVEGIAGTTLTVEDLQGKSKSVAEIVGAILAGNVRITMEYSTDGTTYTAVPYFEVLSAEISARYIQIDVTITDPTLDSNMYVQAITMKAYSGPT